MFLYEDVDCGVMLEKNSQPKLKDVETKDDLLHILKIGIVCIVLYFLGLLAFQLLLFIVFFQSLRMQNLLGIF